MGAGAMTSSDIIRDLHNALTALYAVNDSMWIVLCSDEIRTLHDAIVEAALIRLRDGVAVYHLKAKG